VNSQSIAVGVINSTCCLLDTAKDLAQSRWSANVLRTELIQYAALDAYASARVSLGVLNLLRVHKKPSLEDLDAGVPVRLLPKRGNEPVAYARVETIEEKTEFVPSAESGKLRERTYVDLRLKLVHIARPATLVPPPIPDMDTQQHSLQDYEAGDLISWPRKCLQLSTDEEIELMTIRQVTVRDASAASSGSGSQGATGGDSNAAHGSRSSGASVSRTGVVDGGSGSDVLQGMNGMYDSWRLLCVQVSCDCWNVHSR